MAVPNLRVLEINFLTIYEVRSFLSILSKSAISDIVVCSPCSMLYHLSKISIR